MENAHEPIVSEEQFNAVQVMRGKRRKKYGMASFQSKHLLTGMLFCGKCGGRYYLRNSGKYRYYSCYSRTKQMKEMVRDPECKNKHWKADELEHIIDTQIREVLHSPKLAADIAASRPQRAPVIQNVTIEKRIREIDRSIAKLMELYQKDDIPADVLGDSINKLYAEKTALQNSITPEPEDDVLPFDLAQELLADAAEVWDFADEDQRRRIMQGLISRIVLTDDDVKIEWSF